ncbi:energy-coupling factor transport system permease protein [Nocardia tenerifensis]|uniref:Energy-coupling factor transport system permease protein n=1 Tax=Nocardia tenerifensis TaxID=228006 RepID=A0A318K6F0_9NOCA|nr:energy-coupling factor transporter transmembrane component T [Nocardia tenerifensis]PXX68645.1 energy-coupling factor transport system permease protein [Nocardia tenerifensis]
MTDTVSRPGPAASEAIRAEPHGSVARWTLDPRTTLALLLGANVVIMAPGGMRFVPATLIVGVLLALSERAWRRAVELPVAATTLAAAAYLLPSAAAWPVFGLIAVMAGYALRLVAVGGIAAYLIQTVPPTRFTAALRAALLPSALTVPAAVMLRFVPTVVAEARAVRDAMRLRGLGGWATMLRHPVRSVEYFTVPLMASSLRAAEDLSAAALLRGLGSQARPTSMRPPRFGFRDVVAGLVVAALGIVTLRWRPAR